MQKHKNSFSSDVKNELAKVIPVHKNCRLAELSALLLCGNTVLDDRDGIKRLIISTENAIIAKKVFTIIKKSFKMRLGVSFQQNRLKCKDSYIIEIYGAKTIATFLSELRLRPVSGGGFEFYGKPEKMKSCCKFSFSRGVFLMLGSISDPVKSYHMEVDVSGFKDTLLLQMMLSDITEGLKASKRKGKSFLYIKDSSVIADVLAALGASVAMLNFENARIINETRGLVNRRVNCEIGNLKKAAAAGQKQAKEIELIIEKKGLDSLPENLKQIAVLRINNPGASLQELGEMMTPPLGRSGVNHKLQKLMGIAEGLRTS